MDPLLLAGSCGLLFVTFVFGYFWRKYSFWSSRGVTVPTLKQCFLDRFLRPTHLSDQELYLKYGQIVGLYEGIKPVLLLSDPDIIRNILVKDFNIFPDHRHFDLGSKSLTLNLFNQRGAEEAWKRIRSIISPTFTSGKMRQMVTPINECVDYLLENLEACTKTGKPADLKKFFGAFTMDVISHTAFGIKTDSINNPDNPIVQNARALFNRNLSLKQIFAFMCPGIAETLGVSIFDRGVTDFFSSLVRKIVDSRTGKNAVKPMYVDFVQLMLEAMDGKGKLTEAEENEILSLENYGNKVEANANVVKKPVTKPQANKTMSFDELDGQALVFFLAGYDTTATTLSYTAHLLASYPEIQEKLVKEINTIPEADLDYDTIHQLRYLDAVVWETLRLYPALGRLERESLAEYKIKDFTLPAGSLVSIPIYSLHRDPKYWEDPDTFKPERFMQSDVDQGFGSASKYGAAAKHPYAFLPFGGGPRTCIGMRLALLEMHMCLARVLKYYRFTLAPDSEIIQYSGQILLTQKKVSLRVEKRT